MKKLLRFSIVLLSVINFVVPVFAGMSTKPSKSLASGPASSIKDPCDAQTQVLLEKYGKGGIKAVVIAQGSTGDVLPIIHFARQLSEELPWLEITKFAGYEPILDSLPNERKQFSFCPLMADTMNAYHWNTILNSVMTPFAQIPFVNADEASVQSQLMSVSKIVSDAQIVFYWSCNCDTFVQSPSYLRRMRAFGGRLLIPISPTYMSAYLKYNLMFPGTSVIEIQESFKKSYSNVRRSSWTAKEGIDLTVHLHDNKELHPVREKNVLRNQDVHMKPKTIVGLSKVFFLEQEREGIKNKVVLNGLWHQPPNIKYKPPVDLRTFLDQSSNQKVIYVGLGSFADAVSTKLNKIICHVIESLPEYRFIWSVGKSQVNELLDGRQCIDKARTWLMKDHVPHQWLFQHVDAVVHHGGAGTTQTALLYGVPSIILPQFTGSDQVYFAAMVNHLGIGIGLDDYLHLLWDDDSDHDEKALSGAIKNCTESNDIQRNIEKYQAVMLQETRQNRGARSISEYVFENQSKLDALPIQLRSTTKPCLMYHQEFYLKSQDGRYCQFVDGTVQCSLKWKLSASTFRFTTISNLVHTPTKTFVGADHDVLLSYFNGRDLAFHRFGHRLRVIPATIQANQYDYCIRTDDQIILASKKEILSNQREHGKSPGGFFGFFSRRKKADPLVFQLEMVKTF